MRRLITFRCEGAALAGSLDLPDEGEAVRGILFVTGGRETRFGSHRLYERLATALAATGYAAFRFDRRGTGDSDGEDTGYAGSSPDIAAALAAFRSECPGLQTITGFGLCDGATALALHGRSAGIDRLFAANPWVVKPTDDLPPAAAIRAHYARRLLDPSAWAKLARGGVDFGRLARGVARGATRDDTSLADRFARGLPEGSTIALADGDGTAQAFDGAWRQLESKRPVEIIRIATASHSFAGAADFAALLDALWRHSAAMASSS